MSRCVNFHGKTQSSIKISMLIASVLVVLCVLIMNLQLNERTISFNFGLNLKFVIKGCMDIFCFIADLTIAMLRNVTKHIKWNSYTSAFPLNGCLPKFLHIVTSPILQPLNWVTFTECVTLPQKYLALLCWKSVITHLLLAKPLGQGLFPLCQLQMSLG